MNGYAELMSTDVPVLPPTVIFPDPMIAGDTWEFSMPTAQWSPGYIAVITFAAGVTKLQATATEDAEYFRWTIPGSQTAPLATTIATPYLYTVTVTDSGANRYTIDSGSVTVAPDISVTPIQENRTNLQQMLAAIDNVIIQLCNQKTSEVQFQGQMYKFQDLSKLFSLRESIAARVQDEQDQLRGAARYRQCVATFIEY